MVNLYITEGYYVVSRTDDSVQLKKDKQFSGCVAVFLFLCFLLPFFIYLIIHATMRDKLVYITALPDGSLEITDDKGNVEFCADPDDWEVPSETDYALWFAVGVVVIEFILVIIFFRSLLGIFS